MVPQNLHSLLVTADELREQCHSRGDWGPWQLSREAPYLFTVTPYRYEVDLEWCRTSAQALDWLAQINGKEWGHAATGGLLMALDDVLGLQSSLCGMGLSNELSRSDVNSAWAHYVGKHL